MRIVLNTTRKALLSLPFVCRFLCGAYGLDDKVERGSAKMSESQDWAVLLTIEPSAPSVFCYSFFCQQGHEPAAPLQVECLRWQSNPQRCLRDHVRVGHRSIHRKDGQAGRAQGRRFITVEPGDKRTFRVDLRTTYRFPAGTHRYKIRYSALNPYLGRPGFDTLKSNVADFEFSN